jgi:hypothetical protein
MSGLPKEVPLLQSQLNKPQTTATNASRGPTYNDAFAQFLQTKTKQPEGKPATTPVASKLNSHLKKEAHQTSVIQHAAKGQVNLQQQQNLTVDQNQRVKTERLPQNQVYAIQENTIVTQDGEQQKLYYTILDSTSNNSYGQNLGKQCYGQQQQSF